MKVLLDENLPHQLRHELNPHAVFTVKFMAWSGLKNGVLLARAAAEGFDVMITMDSGVPYQQNLATLPLAVVIFAAVTNDIDDLRPLIPRLLESLRTLAPKSVIRIA